MEKKATEIIRDIKISIHEIVMRIEKLEEDSHPIRDFIRCKQCESRIEDANNLIQRIGDEAI